MPPSPLWARGGQDGAASTQEGLGQGWQSGLSLFGSSRPHLLGSHPKNFPAGGAPGECWARLRWDVGLGFGGGWEWGQ